MTYVFQGQQIPGVVWRCREVGRPWWQRSRVGVAGGWHPEAQAGKASAVIFENVTGSSIHGCEKRRKHEKPWENYRNCSFCCFFVIGFISFCLKTALQEVQDPISLYQNMVTCQRVLIALKQDGVQLRSVWWKVFFFFKSPWWTSAGNFWWSWKRDSGF